MTFLSKILGMALHIADPAPKRMLHLVPTGETLPGSNVQVYKVNWYVLERNKYAPWGRGLSGGKILI